MTYKLPPLPEPIWGYSTSTPKFSAAQMHAYALAALAQPAGMTDTLREAAHQALKELKFYIGCYGTSKSASEAVDNLDAALALAHASVEPVAIALHTGTKQGIKWLEKAVEHGTKLYAAPQPRIWTSEEVDAAVDRALEAVHGIK